MKHVKTLLGFLALAAVIFSCTKNAGETETAGLQRKSVFQVPDIANTAWGGDNVCSRPYEIQLLVREKQPDGTWLWIWGIRNPDPSAIPALTQWSIKLPECIKAENIKLVKQACTGQLYTYLPIAIEANAGYKDCPAGTDVTGGHPVLTFTLGTIGSEITLYGLVLDKEYAIDPNGVAFYKSSCEPGGTGQTCFPGIKCDEPCVEGCSYSQGRYFGNNSKPWPSPTVTVGGHTYTEAEGRALWSTSNAGGIADSKKAFHQVAAIKLSAATVGKCASVLVDVKIIEDWLATLPKLTPTAYKYTNKAAADAAGRIGKWIDEHHCK